MIALKCHGCCTIATPRAILAAVMLLAAAAAASCAPVAADGLSLSAHPVEFRRGEGVDSRVGLLEFRGGLELRSFDSRFGGLSGLELSADGRQMIAVSDHGWWVTADLVHDQADRLIGAGGARIAPMLDMAGAPLPGDKRRADAEAVRDDGDGGLVVSFEGWHRIWRYPQGDDLGAAIPTGIPTPAGLKDAPVNGGIEALTVLADGRLLAITEAFTDRHGRLRGWLIDGDGAVPIFYPLEDEFRPTDLATLPDGQVLVLERRYLPPVSVSARLRRFDPAGLSEGVLIRPEEIARLLQPALVDNFEGLAVRAGSGGETLIYIVSDDNYSLLQRTLLLQFALRE